MDAINTLIALAVVFVTGGLVARLLNAWPAFRDWRPPDVIIKQGVVFLITGLVGGALVWLQTYAVPSYFPLFDPGLKAFLAAVAGFMLSQAVHSADVKAESKP